MRTLYIGSTCSGDGTSLFVTRTDTSRASVQRRYNRIQRMRLTLGILALLLTPPGLPSGGFHWQRTITPPAGAPTAQACILLDAAIFANAAPALRDLRLFQDGFELPYAIEESYDPLALETGTTTADDRSLYDPAFIVNLQQRRQSFVAGDAIPRNFRTHRPGEPGDTESALGFSASLELPPHVPIERLRLDPAPSAPTLIAIVVTEVRPAQADAIGPPPTETITGTIDSQHPALPITIGANLQHRARLTVGIETSGQAFHRVLFDMRRHSLCYQPSSASPLTLYLGGGAGVAAKTYSYASDFSIALDRPYATLGPLVPNPDDALVAAAQPAANRRRHLVWAASLAAAFFVFSAGRMLRKAKNSKSG